MKCCPNLTRKQVRADELLSCVHLGLTVSMFSTGRDLLNTVWKGHSPSNRAYGGEASAPSLTTIKVSKQRPNHEQHILFVAGSTDAENAESKIATAGSPSTHQSLQAHSEVNDDICEPSVAACVLTCICFVQIRSELEQASSNLNIFNSGNEPTGLVYFDYPSRTMPASVSTYVALPGRPYSIPPQMGQRKMIARNQDVCYLFADVVCLHTTHCAALPCFMFQQRGYFAVTLLAEIVSLKSRKN